MKEIKSLQDIYEKCSSDGYFLPLREGDVHRAQSLISSAKRDIENFHAFEQVAKELNDFSTVYKVYYDIVRSLIDAALLAGGFKCSNHQCANAYLCVQEHSDNFDWNILETTRLLRNQIMYEGRRLKEEEWKRQKINLILLQNQLIAHLNSNLK